MLSDDVRSAILARSDWKPKQSRGRVQFRCPRHDDKTPSAWQGGGAWGCFTCGFQESIVTLAAELGIESNGSGDYTIEEYADEKCFSIDTLMSWGLKTVQENGRQVLRIPYLDEHGNELRARFRSRSGKWWEGRDRPIYLYGRDRLVDASPGDRVLIVEGESDCHALWSSGILAVGVPGATTWRPEWIEHLRDLEVYVWEEPDQGGAQMVERIIASFPDARIVRSREAKDASELRLKLGDDFTGRILSLLDGALPYGAHEPPTLFDRLSGDRFSQLLTHQLGPIDAVPTPFPSWNTAARDDGGRKGIARGWHVLAAARTGVGKSILSLNVAAAALRAGEAVCFISLEMSQRQVETRLMAIATGTQVQKLEKGPGFDKVAFKEAADQFEALPGSFITNRSPLYTSSSVVRSITAAYELHGCRYFIIDYLQLAANPNNPESITETSHAIRERAKELEVITFGLSQFNRTTSALNESPMVHGLMGGSSLENDADQVVLIDHSKMVESMIDGQRIGWMTNLLLAKNRHGPPGVIPIHFDNRTLQMRELLDDEIPASLL